MKKLLAFLFSLFIFLSKSFSPTYYVRIDGGSATQSNGKFDWLWCPKHSIVDGFLKFELTNAGSLIGK